MVREQGLEAVKGLKGEENGVILVGYWTARQSHGPTSIMGLYLLGIGLLDSRTGRQV